MAAVADLIDRVTALSRGLSGKQMSQSDLYDRPSYVPEKKVMAPPTIADFDVAAAYRFFSA